MLMDEQIVTFTEAAKLLPKMNGKRPHASSIWRWARKGVQGVRLESRRIGGRFVTSIEALERFTEKLAAIDLPDTPAPPAKLPTASARQRAIENAEAECAAAGI